MEQEGRTRVGAVAPVGPIIRNKPRAFRRGKLSEIAQETFRLFQFTLQSGSLKLRDGLFKLFTRG